MLGEITSRASFAGYISVISGKMILKNVIACVGQPKITLITSSIGKCNVYILSVITCHRGRLIERRLIVIFPEIELTFLERKVCLNDRSVASRVRKRLDYTKMHT